MAERGLIYRRASRDPKHRGTSVDGQIRECQAWAQTNSVEVVRIIRDDDRSASASARRVREGFDDVLDAIRSREIDLLIVWESSRVSRDLAVFIELRAACRASGVGLVSKGRRYDLTHTTDSFTATLDALLAERDASDIRDRDVRTVRRNAELKRPHGRLPYGYHRVYDASTGALLDQTPFVLADADGSVKRTRDGDVMPVLPDDPRPKTLCPEAQVFKDSADAFLGGKSLRRIALDLTDAGVPVPRQPNSQTLRENPEGVVTYWHPGSLRQRLLNPTIAGRRIHQKQDVGEATWAPIIGHGTWLRLRAALTKPSRLSAPSRGKLPRHLLSGIARCGECGGGLKASTNMSRMPLAYTCQHEDCRKVTVSGTRVDEMIEAFVEALLSTPGYRALIADAYRAREGESTGPDASALIAEMEHERDELEALRRGGGITMRAYAAEDKRIEERLDELLAQQVAPVRSAAMLRMFDAETLIEGWRQADLLDKREIVRILVDIRIKRATKRGRMFDYDRVVVAPGELLMDFWTHGLADYDPAGNRSDGDDQAEPFVEDLPDSLGGIAIGPSS